VEWFAHTNCACFLRFISCFLEIQLGLSGESSTKAFQDVAHTTLTKILKSPPVDSQRPGINCLRSVVTLRAISLISAIEQQTKSLKSHASALTFIGEFRSI
jgi:hypothetical protein